MAKTVFYSWQSDLPNKTNRTFIEDALKRALRKVAADTAIEEPERDGPLKLDKDTKGIPGIPPIVDVIFEKISKAAVFVPDLSFVGKSTDGGRLIPNPNVLIEYGWALSARGYSRIVPVMNIAFGDANLATLPFDMRHLRRPITYELKAETSSEERTRIKAELINQLTEAIRLILDSHPAEEEIPIREHVEIESTKDLSTFLETDEPLGISTASRRPDKKLLVPGNEHLFLRVIPTLGEDKISTSKKAYDLLSKSNVKPFSDHVGSWSPGRNRPGAFVCSADEKGNVLALTQLFLNRELWGVDTNLIDKKSCIEWMENKIDFGFFACVSVEKAFINTLETYLPFCRDKLNLQLPLKFIAGATGVEGYKMTLPKSIGFNKFGGNVVEHNIVYEGKILDYDTPVEQILNPFFEYLWEECGLDRPDFKYY